MSTVIRWLGCRFQINTNDHGLPHCHVVGRGGHLKVGLVDFEVLEGSRFSERETKQLVEVVRRYRSELLEKWEQYHGQKEKN